MSTLASIAKACWKHTDVIGPGALGLLVLLSWAIFPTPTRRDLVKVDGVLSSYSIEADESWMAQRRDVYVLFTIADRPGRFWSDAVVPANVRTVFFSKLGAQVSFYRLRHPTTHRINGDGEKTWGLTVNGAEVQSVDYAVAHDAIISHYVLPALGVLLLGLAITAYVRPRAGCR